MPIYEYRCQSCGHEYEVSQRIVEPSLKDCPACHKPDLERLISATSFQLKGGGWYKDGYGGGGNKKPRNENTVGDRVDKALSDDKKKSEPAAAVSSAAESSGASSGSTSTGTGSGSPGSSTGSGGSSSPGSSTGSGSSTNSGGSTSSGA